MCVCVCDLHLQPCRSNAGCMWNCDMLDVIRAWLELMGRVSERGMEADCLIDSHIDRSWSVFLQTVIVGDTESDTALDFFFKECLNIA